MTLLEPRPRYGLDNIPRSIWIRNDLDTLPLCYSGPPLEIIRGFAMDLGFTDFEEEDAVNYVLQGLLGMGLQITLPEDAPRRLRAAFLVLALLVSNLAREMPQA